MMRRPQDNVAMGMPMADDAPNPDAPSAPRIDAEAERRRQDAMAGSSLLKGPMT